MPDARGRRIPQMSDFLQVAAVAKRRRNASRAATLGNSKIGSEIRATRLLVRDLVETTVSGDLDPVVRKRLTELEVASGEAPRFPGKGYAALPEDTSERGKGWAEEEAEREHKREAFMGKLEAVGKDPRAALEGMG